MTQNTLKAALWRELSKQAAIFDEARMSQPPLANHATVLSVLGVLQDETAERYEEKERLTRAIIQEHQASGRRADAPAIRSFWTTLLLAAFYPMLTRLRFAIGPDAVDREDLDQVVVEAFLEEALAMRIEGKNNLILRLKNRTRRAVFKLVRAERRGNRALAELAARHLDDVGLDSPAKPRPIVAEPSGPDEETLAAVLSRRLAGEVSEAHIDLVIATSVRGERLWSVVNRLHPGLTREQSHRAYERIKRTHSRTLARLQKLLRGVEFDVPTSQRTGSCLSTRPEERR